LVIHSSDSTESVGYVGNSRQPSGLLGMVGRILCNGLCNARSKMQSPPLPGDRRCPLLLNPAKSKLQKLREPLRLVPDEELVKFGKMVRGLTEPRVSVMPDTWKEQLQEARAEWRRRQPKAH